MAKYQKTNRQNQLTTHQGRGHIVEQHESYDDSFLPDSIELSRLKELDPEIISWIKEKTGKEQDHRHQFDNKKYSLVNKGTNFAFAIDLITCSFALIVILASMYFSYFLIQKGQNLTGTIFAGATILFAANAFLKFGDKFNKKDKEEK